MGLKKVGEKEIDNALVVDQGKSFSRASVKKLLLVRQPGLTRKYVQQKYTL